MRRWSCALAIALLAVHVLPPRGVLAARARIVNPSQLGWAAPLRPPAGAPTPAQFSLIADLDGWAKDVPASFLGLSHEWTGVDELVDPEALELLRDLRGFDTGPLVLRIGGGSTDLQTTVPDARVWDTLRRLHNDLGVQFILGVNFLSGNFNLTKSQVAAIRREMQPTSVLALELGNEPNFYPSKMGKSAGEYLSCCFVNDWNAVVVPLSCPSGFMSCTEYQFAGPAWGHVNMRPETLDWFMKVNTRWVSTVTVHWYKDRSETYNTAQSLLDEPQMRRDAAALARLVDRAAAWSRALRVAEMNSISNNGRRGVSDTMSGALWSLDAALEAAAAGAIGVNFHWGSGNNVYSAIIRRTKDGKPPIVKPAFYAYLLLQIALSGGARVLLAQPTVSLTPSRAGTLKAWALAAKGRDAVRVVIINKAEAEGAELTVTVNRGHYGDGRLMRLTAPGGLSASGGARLGGASYRWEGSQVAGTAAAEPVPMSKSAGGGCTYRVYMPPASAALLIVGSP